MAATFAEVWAQRKALIDVWYTSLTNASSLLTKLDTYTQALEGDGAMEAAALARQYRSAYASAMDRVAAADARHLIDLKRAIGSSAAASSARFWLDLSEYMITNSQSVNSRAITYGSVSAGGGNVGTGTIYRLTEDERDKPIEAVVLDVASVRCTKDRQGGAAVGREEFELYYGDEGLDVLESLGSAERGRLLAHSGDELLANASFQTLEGSAASPTDIPGWTVTDLSNVALAVNSSRFTFDETNYFRASPDEAAAELPRALNIKVSCRLRQYVRELGISLDFTKPYLAGCRWNRQVGSGAGDLKIAMGAEEVTVTAAAQTGWQTLILAQTEDLWYATFNEDDLDFMIEWTRTSGDLLIDDVFFAAMDRFGNLWYFALGGATPFKRGDIFTFTDALSGSEAKVQRFHDDVYNVWLPSDNAAGETITDP